MSDLIARHLSEDLITIATRRGITLGVLKEIGGIETAELLRRLDRAEADASEWRAQAQIHEGLYKKREAAITKLHAQLNALGQDLQGEANERVRNGYLLKDAEAQLSALRDQQPVAWRGYRGGLRDDQPPADVAHLWKPLIYVDPPKKG